VRRFQSTPLWSEGESPRVAAAPGEVGTDSGRGAVDGGLDVSAMSGAGRAGDAVRTEVELAAEPGAGTSGAGRVMIRSVEAAGLATAERR